LAVAAVALLGAGVVAAVVHDAPTPATVVAADDDGGGAGRPSTTTTSTSTTPVTIPVEPSTTVVAAPPTTTSLPVVTAPVTVPKVTVPPVTAPKLPVSLVRPVADVDGPGLYLVDVDGRNLRRVLAGRAAFPSWSPDGSRIAFTLDDVLQVTNLDGRTTVLSRDAVLSRFGPSWTADGSRVGFPGKGADGRDPWTVGADGTGATRLDHAGDDAAAAVGPAGVIATMGTNGLFVSDPAGSSWRRLGERTYNFGQLRWSPDGTRLATAPDSMAVDQVVDVATGTAVALGGTEAHRTDGLSWCPDGRNLVLEGYFRDQQVFGLWLAPAAGGAPTLLAADHGDADCHADDLVVAVQQGNNSGRPWALVALRTDGLAPRTLLTHGTDGMRALGHPQVSPDGRTIAFVAYR
jgi:Tol biopolymer transport system component